jgi:DNA-binding beta-propeller fold protein YncE
LAAILLFISSFILSQGDTTFPIIVRWALRVMAIGGVIYYYRTDNDDQADQEPRQLRNRVALLSLFTLLSLLTIRFTYMANYRNADYTTEFMVYAHGAPATKDIVMTQLEELSMRMNGDKSIRVAYDNDVSWPFTWYLRDYPNRYYFGASPNNSITESPIVIVGRASWEKVEPFLANNYEVREYTFLWWPMEEYRNWSWNAFLGDPLAAEPRGLGNANVRQALWDIFFYRDYEKYGQVFGGNYTVGEWPVRHDLRLYIRKDVLANLWDYGVGAVTAVEALKDPYEENELTLEPVMTVGSGQGTAEGQFSSPRNVAVSVDGTIYVLDSGNNRVQMFTPEGEFISSWGESGTGSGQFNEPWGIVVDENFVYVADTWNHRIQKFSLVGEWVNAFGISGSPTDENRGLGLFFGPRSLTLLPDNRLLVTDTGNHRLQVLSRDGQFITEVGSQGPALGQVNEPVGLATGPDDSVYLADTWNGRVQQFSPELIALNDWRVEAWFGTNIVNKPYLAVDSQGRIYVSDPEGYRILVFNSDGDYLARFGSFGSEATNLGLPNGLAIDAQDNLYVADADNHRILKYAPLFGVPSTELEPLDSVDEEQIDEGETADEETEPTPTAEEPTPTAEE